jgi:hypothetical protein
LKKLKFCGKIKLILHKISIMDFWKIKIKTYQEETNHDEPINQIEKLGWDKRQKLLKEFSEYIEKDYWLDFKIKKWEIDVNNIWWFSDWVYKLKNYNIELIAEEQGIYTLELDFKLKKKWLTYTNTVNLSFHYENWNEMIIKYRGEFYRINFWDKILEKRHRKWNTIIREEVWKKIPIKIDKLKLLLEFKTD